VVNLLTAKASRESIITIFNGHQWRPFIHVKDVAEAIVHVLESSVRFVGGQVFNVGDSRLNHTLSEVAGLIRDAFPTTRVEHVDNGDRRNYRVSFKKLEQRVAFRARYSVQDGIQELKNAFEERLIADYTDLRYHNQRFLKEAGGPGHKNEMDVKVMAAFAGVSVNGRAAEPHGQNGNYKQVVRGS